MGGDYPGSYPAIQFDEQERRSVMPKISITTNQGILIEQIDIEGYDISKSIARASITGDIFHFLEKAFKIEKEENERRAQGWIDAGYIKQKDDV